MTGYLTLILFNFFDSPEKNFASAENVHNFAKQLYKIAFFSKTIKSRVLRIVSIEIFCPGEHDELSIHQIGPF